jgi:hypothetical protein
MYGDLMSEYKTVDSEVTAVNIRPIDNGYLLIIHHEEYSYDREVYAKSLEDVFEILKESFSESR